MSSRPISRVLLAALLAAGCTQWQRLPDVSPDTLPSRRQVQVWSGNRVRVLHAVRLGDDSIRGVPYHLPPSCDSCRVAIARASADSLRWGNQESNAMVWIGLAIVTLLSLLVMLSGLGGS